MAQEEDHEATTQQIQATVKRLGKEAAYQSILLNISKVASADPKYQEKLNRGVSQFGAEKIAKALVDSVEVEEDPQIQNDKQMRRDLGLKSSTLAAPIPQVMLQIAQREEELRNIRREKNEAVMQQAQILAKTHKSYKAIPETSLAKSYIKEFFTDAVGFDPGELGKAAEDYLDEQVDKLAGRAALSKQLKDMTPEELMVRGESHTSLGLKSMAGGQLLLTALNPAAMAGYLALGAVSNLNNGFRGYAIMNPDSVPVGIGKNPMDMSFKEYDEHQQKLRENPAKYFASSDASQVAQILAKLYGRTDKISFKDEVKIQEPQIDITQVPQFAFNELPRNSKLVRIGNTPVFKVYTPKEMSEIVNESAATLATLGLQGQTPGQALAIQTGTEGTVVPLMADLILGSSIGIATGSQFQGVIKNATATESKAALQGVRGNRGVIRGLSGLKEIGPNLTIDQKVAIEYPNTTRGIYTFESTMEQLSKGEPPAIKHLVEKSTKIMESIGNGPTNDAAKVMESDVGPIGNFFGTLGFQSKKLGQRTLRIANDIFMGEVYRNYDINKSLKWWNEEVWSKIRPQNRERFAKSLMGKTVGDIEAGNPKFGTPEYDVLATWSPEEIDAIKKLKFQFEVDRQMIFQETQGRVVGHIGTYFPGVFKGRLEVNRPDGSRAGFVDTKAEFNLLVEKDAMTSGMAKDRYTFNYKPQNASYWQVLPQDMQKLVVKELAASAGLEEAEILSRIDDLGINDRRSPFFMKKKTFAPNYEEDANVAMNVYFRAMANYKHLKPISDSVLGEIQKLKSEGRPHAAGMMQRAWDGANGQPTPLSVWFDRTLYKALGPIAKPRLLDRWSSGLKSTQAMFYLANPNFAGIINPSQPFETLSIYGNTQEFRDAFNWIHSPQGKMELARFGHLEPGSKFTTMGENPISTAKGNLNRLIFASEDHNLKWAWGYMYKKGLAAGLSPEEANRMGVIRGMMGTQYMGLMSDRPWFSRGPVSSFFQQFTRFGVKNIEQLLDLIRDKDYPAVAKYMGSKLLLGGARPYITFEMYKEIRKHDENLADVIYFGGLGELLGADLSSSYAMMGFGPGKVEDKIANSILGVPGQTMVQSYRAMMEDGAGPDVGKALSVVTTKIPAGKLIRQLGELWDPEKEIVGPDGEKLFVENATAYYKGLLGLTDKNISIARDLARNHKEIKMEMSRVRQIAYKYWMQDLMTEDPKNTKYADKGEKIVDDFNDRYAPFVIQKDKSFRRGFVRYLRVHDPEGTLYDRMLQSMGKQERNIFLQEIEEMDLEEQIK